MATLALEDMAAHYAQPPFGYTVAWQEEVVAYFVRYYGGADGKQGLRPLVGKGPRRRFASLISARACTCFRALESFHFDMLGIDEMHIAVAWCLYRLLWTDSSRRSKARA